MSNFTLEALDTRINRAMAARPSDVESMSQLIMGDATRLGVLPKESVDLIITSPPYNVGKAYNGYSQDDALYYADYEKFSKKWLGNCYKWARPSGRLCVNVSIDKNKHGKQPLSADVTRWAMDAGWNYHATILWNEGNISRRTAWGSWMSASAPHIIAPVEVVIVLYKGNWKKSSGGKSDISRDEFMNWVLGIWQFNGESAKRIGHEAPFPRDLPRRCIKLFSFVGDTVLDPFSGSGTTMIEAVQNRRHAVGIELEEKYCKLSLNRMEKECGVKLKKLRPERAAKSIQGYWTL